MISSTETAASPSGATHSTLTAGEQDCLRCIAAAMIPADAALGVPGAADPVVFSAIIASLDRDRVPLVRLLDTVDQAAGGRLADLDAVAQEALLASLRAADPATFAVVEAVIVRGYYRDDRVLVSIGMEARPPFPKGYALPPTDWSLLDPVRARGSICRDADLPSQ